MSFFFFFIEFSLNYKRSWFSCEPVGSYVLCYDGFKETKISNTSL